MNSLGAKRATITGANSGIGRETAIAFANAGVEVALVGRNRDKLEAVRAEIGSLVRAKVYTIDLAQLDGVETAMAEAAADFGGVDILVNNAGMGYTNPLSETSLADWQRVIDLNLTSVFLCIKALLPGMRSQGKGTIINVASVAAEQSFPGWGCYSASKAALAALSRILAAEEKANGIRAVTISPGAVNTPLWDTETVKIDLDRQTMLSPQVVAQSIVHAALLPDGAAVEAMTLMPSTGAL